MVNKHRIHDLFGGLQNALKASLNIGNNITHPGTKGDYSENHWLKLFNDYLPKRYNVAKAFVIDCEGNSSEQIDLVVFDNYFSPFLFNHEGAIYIPAESVYAVFEVKQSLNKEHFEYAKQKIASVRNLKRTSVCFISCGKTVPGRKPGIILGGLLATRNEWFTVLEKQETNINSPEHLNMGCCVNDKSWIFDNNKYIWSKDSESSLLAFFMSFLFELQKIGSVPAIDIDSYYNGFK